MTRAVITDGFDGYIDLGQDFRHYSMIQGSAKNTETILPVILVLSILAGHRR